MQHFKSGGNSSEHFLSSGSGIHHKLKITHNTHLIKAFKNKITIKRNFIVFAGQVSSNDLKNGITLEIDSQPWKVVEFLHVKPGKGAAFVRSKIKNCISGSVIDKTFRAGEMIETADVSKRDCQYIYNEGNTYVFMDMETYEEARVDRNEEWAKYLKEGGDASLLFYKGSVISVDIPQSVNLTVAYVDPGVRGNTASGGSKPATLETGAVIQVPLFIKEGEIIKIDTKREIYLSRA